jgi:predicted transcriptional regulator
MTVEELKAEAGKLRPDDLFALAEWIEQNDEVRSLRHEKLVREIQHGIEQANRGELHEADEVFSRLRTVLKTIA